MPYMYRFLSLGTLLFLCLLISTHASADEQEVLNRLDRVERDLITIQQELFQGGGGYSSQTSTESTSGGISSPAYEVRLIEIEEQMRNLNGKIEQLEFLIKQAQSNSGASSSTTNNTPLTQTLDQDQPKDVDEASALYNKAFSYLQKGLYQQAEEYLLLFLKRHPNHNLASNAFYWLGETYYVQRDFEQAAIQFLKGYQKFPKGGKSPDSLLKLAITLVSLDKKEEACTTLDKLDNEFPNASRSIKLRADKERQLIQCS